MVVVASSIREFVIGHVDDAVAGAVGVGSEGGGVNGAGDSGPVGEGSTGNADIGLNEIGGGLGEGEGECGVDIWSSFLFCVSSF